MTFLIFIATDHYALRFTSLAKKLTDTLDQRAGLFKVRKMPGPFDDLEPSPEDRIAIGGAVITWSDKAVARAPQK